MILIGDVEVRLAELPSDHFDCVVTSPPYWGLRDYGAEGQIGLEPTMQEHIDRMVIVCAEIHRVLKPSGTFWLNYGDCYAGSWSGNSMRPNGGTQRAGKPGFQPLDGRVPARNGHVPDGLKPKDLCMIPNRLAIALQEWGWWVRSEIIWGKPNPMPESVTDRPATAHEKIWLLTKKGRYFYDNEAVRVQGKPESASRYRYAFSGTSCADEVNDRRTVPEGMREFDGGRNLRNYEPAPVQVWHMATQPFPGAHFATFPPELVERCLMAGTSQRGCCAECRAPWVRDVEKVGEIQTRWAATNNLAEHASRTHRARTHQNIMQTSGWSRSCACDAATVPARVLDPFGGSGTVGLVADSMGLDWTLIELNPEYAAMAEARIKSRVAGKGRKERCEDTDDLFELDAPRE